MAADHLRRKQYAEARAAWQAFVPSTRLMNACRRSFSPIGESYATEKKPDQAIAAWKPLLEQVSRQ